MTPPPGFQCAVKFLSQSVLTSANDPNIVRNKGAIPRDGSPEVGSPGRSHPHLMALGMLEHGQKGGKIEEAPEETLVRFQAALGRLTWPALATGVEPSG